MNQRGRYSVKKRLDEGCYVTPLKYKGIIRPAILNKKGALVMILPASWFGEDFGEAVGQDSVCPPCMRVLSYRATDDVYLCYNTACMQNIRHYKKEIGV